MDGEKEYTFDSFFGIDEILDSVKKGLFTSEQIDYLHKFIVPRLKDGLLGRWKDRVKSDKLKGIDGNYALFCVRDKSGEIVSMTSCRIDDKPVKSFTCANLTATPEYRNTNYTKALLLKTAETLIDRGYKKMDFFSDLNVNKNTISQELKEKIKHIMDNKVLEKDMADKIHKYLLNNDAVYSVLCKIFGQMLSVPFLKLYAFGSDEVKELLAKIYLAKSSNIEGLIKSSIEINDNYNDIHIQQSIDLTDKNIREIIEKLKNSYNKNGICQML